MSTIDMEDFNEISQDFLKNESEESLFNSKLFIDLDDEEENQQNVNLAKIEEEKDNTDTDLKHFLSNELIEEIDSSTSCPTSPELLKKNTKENSSTKSNEDSLSLEKKNSEKEKENFSDETISSIAIDEENKKENKENKEKGNKEKECNKNIGFYAMGVSMYDSYYGNSYKNKFGQYIYLYPCILAPIATTTSNNNVNSNTNDLKEKEKTENSGSEADLAKNVIFTPVIPVFGGNKEYFSKRVFSPYKYVNKQKKKIFTLREGDWKCAQCNNLNFSFRKKCNKCNITKEESIDLEKVYNCDIKEKKEEMEDES